MRWVSFTDRYGAEEDDDITLGRLAELLATIAMYDGDDEHRSISVSDSDAGISRRLRARPWRELSDDGDRPEQRNVPCSQPGPHYPHGCTSPSDRAIVVP